MRFDSVLDSAVCMVSTDNSALALDIEIVPQSATYSIVGDLGNQGATNAISDTHNSREWAVFTINAALTLCFYILLTYN